MKRKILSRAVSGIWQGIAIGYIITIISSVIWGNGYYSPCVPQLAETMGSEISAVIVQTILCGIIGSGYAATSVVWEMDNLSILKQTGICFGVYSIIMLPVAYAANWMEHSLTGFISYLMIFIVIFIAVWIFQYFVWKSNIKRMNKKLN